MSQTAYRFKQHDPQADPAPLFFVFHGTGGDENQFFDLGRQLLPGARVVAARGDVSEGGALRFFRRTAEGVYDMDDLRGRTAAMADFVRAHRDAHAPTAVYGLGYSNGANILASVMFAAPDLFDTAILMHPLIPFIPRDEPGLAGKKVLITAGRQDPICPPPATEALGAYFERQGSAVQLAWHPGGHEVRQEELAAIAEFLGSQPQPS